jgi:transposase
LAHTALLLTDVQEQIFFHMPPEGQKTYLETVKRILDHFRSQIAARRAEKENAKAGSADLIAPNEGIP